MSDSMHSNANTPTTPIGRILHDVACHDVPDDRDLRALVLTAPADIPPYFSQAASRVQSLTAPVLLMVEESDEDMHARVLAIVSKVSAFPVDAIRDEQRLLDDLGFDSLMLAELSTKIGDVVPGFPGIPRSLFASSPTVADLVRHVEGAGASDVALGHPTAGNVRNIRSARRLGPFLADDLGQCIGGWGHHRRVIGMRGLQ